MSINNSVIIFSKSGRTRHLKICQKTGNFSRKDITVYTCHCGYYCKSSGGLQQHQENGSNCRDRSLSKTMVPHDLSTTQVSKCLFFPHWPISSSIHSMNVSVGKRCRLHKLWAAIEEFVKQRYITLAAVQIFYISFSGTTLLIDSRYFCSWILTTSVFTASAIAASVYPAFTATVFIVIIFRSAIVCGFIFFIQLRNAPT